MADEQMSRQLYTHISGEVYAVEMMGDAVGGVCGPLHHSEYTRQGITEEVEYSFEDADWAKQEMDAGRLRLRETAE